MKSPALNQVLLPLRQLETVALNNFTAIQAQYELDQMKYVADKKNIETQIKKGATVLPGQLPVPPIEPQPQRYLVNDSTYQKLGAVWVQVDRLPDIAAATAAEAVFTRLATLDPIALGARQLYPDSDSIPVFRFAEDAQTLFNSWWSELKNSWRRDELHPALESHISKYRKLVPALALLISHALLNFAIGRASLALPPLNHTPVNKESPDFCNRSSIW